MIVVFLFLTYFTLYGNLYIHPCHCKWHCFISFYGWVMFHCIHAPFHSSVDGHLGCFLALAIVNSAAKNFGNHVSFRIMVLGCSPWGCKEWDTTERLHFHFSLSCIGEGNGNPFQHSCLENPSDGGAWWAAVYGVTQSRTRLKRLSSSSSPTYEQEYDCWITW